MKVIDASECIMGRLASAVAKSLLNGEEIHIVNAENAVISGSKDMVFDMVSFPLRLSLTSYVAF